MQSFVLRVEQLNSAHSVRRFFLAIDTSPEPEKKFDLPKANKDMRRVFAYHDNRNIDQRYVLLWEQMVQLL